MLLKIPVNPVKPLLGALAALFLALPARAQETGDPPAPEPSADQGAPEAGAEAGSPENASEDPAAAEPAAADEAAAGPAAEEEAAGAGEPVVVDIGEGTVIDDQTFEGEDDDFIPSEEIPIDQAIPFPTDI
ncbi:MAG TPA: hypothetical protein VFG91_00710 [Woeseiaceae bacterium]|nr:hypothetical protein [Woeseiaceae bacterium]